MHTINLATISVLLIVMISEVNSTFFGKGSPIRSILEFKKRLVMLKIPIKLGDFY